MRTRFQDDEAFSKESLLPEVNMGLPVEDLFGSTEADLILNDMGTKNEIFYSDDVVYRL